MCRETAISAEAAIRTAVSIRILHHVINEECCGYREDERKNRAFLNELWMPEGNVESRNAEEEQQREVHLGVPNE
jgi:hypothetical protein